MRGSLTHHGLCSRSFSTEEVMARPETPKLYAATYSSGTRRPFRESPWATHGPPVVPATP